ncbi:MAG: hypothetical protein JWM57_3414 [Phycisphaerales bacterium]|nr:hypothetical protein [Phycisphaerales bacterium]
MQRIALGLSTLLLTAAIASANTPAPPQVPANVQGKDGVKAYLVTVVESCNVAAADLKAAATTYADLVKAAGSPAAAAQSESAKVADAIKKMRDAYQRLDSFGYEYVEGIVAGVPGLEKYDVELDSGLPKADATSPSDVVADVIVHAGPDTLDHQGSLNNFLIEPTVFGTNPKFIDGAAVLPGMGTNAVGLPKPQLAVALADYAIDGYGRLLKDSKAWQPTDKDCFQAVYNMTPTLADYFDEWKETKKTGAAPGGRFVAVSRVSDMRGIMSSVQLTWDGLMTDVKAKDPALAESVTRGYGQILTFINTVDTRDQQKPLTIEAIDALGSQAKDKADKLTAQTQQAAALLGVTVDAK